MCLLLRVRAFPVSVCARARRLQHPHLPHLAVRCSGRWEGPTSAAWIGYARPCTRRDPLLYAFRFSSLSSVRSGHPSRRIAAEVLALRADRRYGSPGVLGDPPVCAIVLGSVVYWDASGHLVNGRLIDAGLIARAALLVRTTFLPPSFSGSRLPGHSQWKLSSTAFSTARDLRCRACRGRTSRSARRAAVLAPAILLLAVGLAGKATAAYLVPPPAPYAGWQQDWHSVMSAASSAKLTSSPSAWHWRFCVSTRKIGGCVFRAGGGALRWSAW